MKDSTERTLIGVGAVVTLLVTVIFVIYHQKDTTLLKGHDAEAGVLTPQDRRFTISIGGKVLKTVVADTVETQVTGLSGREGLQEDEVMLFIFGKPDFYGIWMKDMKFPIDIFWLDHFGKIVSLEKDVREDTFPKIFTPIAPAQYVLEAKAGFAEKNQLKIGGQFNFSQN